MYLEIIGFQIMLKETDGIDDNGLAIDDYITVMTCVLTVISLLS